MPPFPDRYRAMSSFVAPALQRSALWQTVLAFVATLIFTAFALVIYGMLLGVVLAANGQSFDPVRLFGPYSPQGLLGVLSLFLPTAVGLILGVAAVLRRGPRSLTGPLRPALRNFLRVAVPVLLLGLILLPLSLYDPNVHRNLSLSRYLPLLVLAVPALLIQTGTEELFFRGFLQQQIAARFRAPLIWLGVPTLLFAAGHYTGAATDTASLLVICWTGIFGLAAADLTARTGNLGAAYGLHFANNVMAVLVVGTIGPLGQLALYNVFFRSFDLAATLPYLAVDVVLLFVNWLLARLMLRV